MYVMYYITLYIYIIICTCGKSIVCKRFFIFYQQSTKNHTFSDFIIVVVN